MFVKNVLNVLRRVHTKPFKGRHYINTSAIHFKIVKCKLYDIGEGISEVEITKWNKNEGDHVSEMESLLTVQSDKAAVDITSKYNGVLVKKYLNENDMLKVGSYFCEIDTDDDIIETNEEGVEKEENNKREEDDESSLSLNDDSSTNDNIKASPGVKRKAKEYKVNLNKVGDYFNKVNITLEDLELYYNNVVKNEYYDNKDMDVIDEVSLKGIKLAMCKSMNESLQIPLFHLNEMCIINNLIKMRKAYKEEQKNILTKETNITITCILIKLISNVLKEFPILNSKFNFKTNTYTMYKNHNISIAVDTPHGLLVPNIKNVQNKNILDIQKDLLLLRDKANNMQLSKNDITNGTITISNFGAISGTFATPIVFDNQACIIGIGKMEKKLLLKDHSSDLNSLNDILVADTINFTFGADHRYIDGATLAQFSKMLKRNIENCESLGPLLE
ncbi:lipoamide acyltransferase component of branched- chain alpha-keto acid dehydrogenase complex [Plasmodium gaboni]|uniref:Dihydrolipoamide acetyltransferase component of pyruvate dehydrogenase complex n=1 Tax=Plasmodium gaboni TaxID=647221 RepID=A0A151LVE7_9APIC|nr:lipoamide acyltransferase component of branched- chain alpha-keto acid dehydrogenase complex [Plasmodium gaboni]KYO03156.1 lipoamide acyltransferase component of branched- chain alpha-keto acid dehydrogenase complex [Plasmodium gaboni]